MVGSYKFYLFLVMKLDWVSEEVRNTWFLYRLTNSTNFIIQRKQAYMQSTIFFSTKEF